MITLLLLSPLLVRFGHHHPPASVFTGDSAIPIPTWLAVLSVAVMLFSFVPTVVSVVAAMLTLAARKAYEEGREKINDDVAKAKESIDRIRDYELAVRQSAGAFFPAGHFLSARVSEAVQPSSDPAVPAVSSLKGFADSLARAFIENAEYGQMIQQLYTGEADRVIAAAAYLSQYPSVHTLAILRERLDVESTKVQCNTTVIKSLTLADREVTEAVTKMAGAAQ